MSHKIAIEDVVYLVEKRLGIDGVQACDYIYTYLGKVHKDFKSKYMNMDDLVYLRDSFLKMVDIPKLNNLDYQSFLQHTNELLESGSKIKTASSENKKTNPPIIFVSLLGK